MIYFFEEFIQRRMTKRSTETLDKDISKKICNPPSPHYLNFPEFSEFIYQSILDKITPDDCNILNIIPPNLCRNEKFMLRCIEKNSKSYTYVSDNLYIKDFNLKSVAINASVCKYLKQYSNIHIREYIDANKKVLKYIFPPNTDNENQLINIYLDSIITDDIIKHDECLKKIINNNVLNILR